MGFEPKRMAVAGDASSDVEHILDREGAAEQRAVCAAFAANVCVAAKRIERVVDLHIVR
jgi:hypothetical protein